jgi:septum formation topological specificity factor MinE
MDKNLVYVPVFRGLQEENKVLKSFDFGDQIYPCLEIVKELDRLPTISKDGKKESTKTKSPKNFESVYLALIHQIKARHVFVDLPIQVKPFNSMKPESIQFLTTVVRDRHSRTEYLKRLNPLRKKIIPVISSYFEMTNERESIKLQEADLRPTYDVLAFRTTYDNLSRDFKQLKTVMLPQDYLIVDWCENDVDNKNDDNQERAEMLHNLEGTIIIHRNSIPNDVTNVGLDHGKMVTNANNNLLTTYKALGGHCFSDYCGIKKHKLNKGGTISPGFLYYDAVINRFYGFKGLFKELSEFTKTIVPAILSSPATKRMKDDDLDFLSQENLGWATIMRISKALEPGRSASKFKRIGIEHYLHCVKTKINSGYLSGSY